MAKAFRFPCLKTGLTKLAFEKIRRIGSTVPKEVRATVQSARSFGASMAFGPWRAFGSERRWTFERVAAFSMHRVAAVERNVVKRLTVQIFAGPFAFKQETTTMKHDHDPPVLGPPRKRTFEEGVRYMNVALASFENDPPDSDYQCGYLAACENIAREVFGFTDIPAPPADAVGYAYAVAAQQAAAARKRRE